MLAVSASIADCRVRCAARERGAAGKARRAQRATTAASAPASGGADIFAC